MPYTEDELKIVRQFYDLRKKYRNDVNIQNKLNEVFNLIVSGQINAAKEELNSISR